MKGHLEVFPTAQALVRGAAEKIAALLNESISARGVASFALSGGSTPRSVFEVLGSDEYRSRIPWRKVHFFWGDERCVEPFMPDSNFRMANETLLKKIGVPEKNIHRIMAEHHPQDAALSYELLLKKNFSLNEGQLPEFDVLLLGLGEDGHTASLFPGAEVLHDLKRLVAEVFVEKLAAYRVTLTLPVINNSSVVLFLVSGKTKAEILCEVLEDEGIHYPAQMIDPVSKQLFWLVDQDAASKLRMVRTT